MADETEPITDLESFHRELQDGVNNVRQLVAAWMPKRKSQANSSQAAKSSSGPEVGGDASHAFAGSSSSLPFKGRPERLGIGAAMPKQVQSGANLANPNSKEAKLLKNLMGANNKRKVMDDGPSQHLTYQSLANPKTKPSKGGAAAADDDDDDDDGEDSRAKSISVKKAKFASANALFHDKKPKKQHVPSQKAPMKHNVITTAPPPRLQTADLEGQSPSGTPQPATSTSTSTSPPPSPTRLSEVKPPYAIPPTLRYQSRDASVDEQDESMLEEGASILTIQTDSTLQGSTANPVDAEKKKRKRKKKKKQQQMDLSLDSNSTPSQVNERLFGDSVLS